MFNSFTGNPQTGEQDRLTANAGVLDGYTAKQLYQPPAQGVNFPDPAESLAQIVRDGAKRTERLEGKTIALESAYTILAGQEQVVFNSTGRIYPWFLRLKQIAGTTGFLRLSWESGNISRDISTTAFDEIYFQQIGFNQVDQFNITLVNGGLLSCGISTEFFYRTAMPARVPYEYPYWNPT